MTLMSGGSKVVTGRVESIDPLNTIIRDDEGVPITIPNTVMLPTQTCGGPHLHA